MVELLVALSLYGGACFLIGKTHAEHRLWWDGATWGREWRRGMRVPDHIEPQPQPRPNMFDWSTHPDVNVADDIVIYARTIGPQL